MPKKPAKTKKSTRTTTRKAAIKTTKRSTAVRKSAPKRTTRAKKATRPTTSRTANSSSESTALSNQHLVVLFLICLVLFLLTISRVGL